MSEYEDNEYLLQLLEAYEKLEPYSGTAKWFKPGPYSIDNCPKHKLFFELGSMYPERFFMAANRVGKSIGGAFEMACHLTGIYPEWWTGKRFDHPIQAWAGGQTGQTTRDTVQKELLGDVGKWGTGMIPLELIGRTWARQGVPNGIDTVEVKHISGGVSSLGFKSYDQDIKAFYGTARHVIWLDEECPELIYNECMIRTMTTKGILYVTFTPLHGVTALIVGFDKEAEHLGGAARITSLSDEDQKRIDSMGTKTRAIVQAGWDDAPWLSGADKERYRRGTPPHLRDARSKGIPSLGAGNIYPIPLDDVLVEPFEVPLHYRRMYAMDVGWNATAVLCLAIDPDTDTAYIYTEYKRGQAEPAVHAARIKELQKGWIPGVIDPAAHTRSQVDGAKLVHLYRQMGLKLREAKNEVEAGIYGVWERLSSGKLKVFKNLHSWREEYVLYRRDMDGKIIKENDHLMDCMRYLINNINMARPPHQDGPFTGGRGVANGGASGRNYF